MPTQARPGTGEQAKQHALAQLRQTIRGFTAFALAGVSRMVFIGLAALRGARGAPEDSAGRALVGAHGTSAPSQGGVYGHRPAHPRATGVQACGTPLPDAPLEPA
ncbi:hypothetical protein [Streptomyces sp. NPDC058735]|uniref:hypothetical protein n=1 Tax=unclassified Streptomyces TaxID=2593676 RepID=UPI0036CEA66B